MVCDVPLHNRCPFACSVDCPQASSRLIFVAERDLWSYRPLTSPFSFCALYCLPLVHTCNRPAFLRGTLFATGPPARRDPISQSPANKPPGPLPPALDPFLRSTTSETTKRPPNIGPGRHTRSERWSGGRRWQREWGRLLSVAGRVGGRTVAGSAHGSGGGSGGPGVSGGGGGGGRAIPPSNAAQALPSHPPVCRPTHTSRSLRRTAAHLRELPKRQTGRPPVLLMSRWCLGFAALHPLRWRKMLVQGHWGLGLSNT